MGRFSTGLFCLILPDRFGAFAEDRKVCIVDEETVTLPPGDLSEHTEILHVRERFRDGWRGYSDGLSSSGDRDDGISLHMFEYAQDRCGRAAQCFDLAAVVLKDGYDSSRGAGSLLGGVPDAGQEEVDPRLPIAPGPHPVE